VNLLLPFIHFARQFFEDTNIKVMPVIGKSYIKEDLFQKYNEEDVTKSYQYDPQVDDF